MDQAKREKQIEVIRQLLAQAYDSSVTEQEALAFRNLARKRMDEYCISEIGDVSPEQALPVLEEKLRVADDIRIDRNLLVYLPYIIQPIATFFSCATIVTVHGGARNYIIVGYKPNIQMVQYGMDVVLRQGISEYREAYKRVRSLTFGASFWQGFAYGLCEKFKIVRTDEERGLVLYDRVKANMEARKLGSYVAEMGGSTNEFQSGKTAGENVTLNRPIHAGNGGKFIA